MLSWRIAIQKIFIGLKKVGKFISRVLLFRVFHQPSWQALIKDLYRRHQRLIDRAIIIIGGLLIIYILLILITWPPRYSKEETIASAHRLSALINEQPTEIQSLFRGAMEILKQEPHFYRKVVNNIQDIKVEPGCCPYACIYSGGYTVVHGMGELMIELIMPQANFNEKTLIINPQGIKRFRNSTDFAALLVHEADHVEYMESSRTRRAGLFFKCNPVLNPHISLFSMLPSISHRVEVMEICAEKEQIAFYKARKAESGFLSLPQAIAFPFLFVLGFFQSMFSDIKYIWLRYF